jgi:hypothetical protein
LRQLAEQNVERARQLYLQFVEGIAQTMAVWATPASDSMSPGFNRVRARAVKFALLAEIRTPETSEVSPRTAHARELVSSGSPIHSRQAESLLNDGA